jgi:hypothetical protein
MPRKLMPCGTNAAYVRHVRRNEPTCQPCRDAHAEYGREHVDGGRPRGVAKCGTQAGYDKHLRRREETCAECRAAHSRHVGKYAKAARARAEVSA